MGLTDLEKQYERLTYTYEALLQTNRITKSCKNEQVLFDAVCKIAVEYGGMRMAWIGRNLANDSISVISKFGNNLEYLDDIFISIREDIPEGNGPTGTTLREGNYIIVQDYIGSVANTPWKEKAAKTGKWLSSGAFAIKRNGKPYAVLTIYHGTAVAFDVKTISLLQEMAANIGYALDVIDIEVGQQNTARELEHNRDLLDKSNKRFTTIFEDSPEPMWVVDDGKFIDCNKAGVEIFGFSSKGDIIDRSPATFSPEYQIDGEYSQAKALRLLHNAAQGIKQQFEWLHKKADGSKLYAIITLTSTILEGKTVVLGTGHDITIRKQLEESKNKLSDIIEHSVNEVYLFDFYTMKFEYANEGAKINLGYTLEQLCELTPFDLMENYSRLEFYNNLTQMARAKKAYYVFETTHIRKDRSTYAAEVHIQLANSSSVNKKVFLAIVLDITKRKKAEEKQILIDKIFCHTQEGICITEVNGTIVDVNDAFCQITGYTKYEVIGSNPRLLKSGCQSKEFYDEMWRVIKEEGHWSGEFWNRKKDGTIYPELMSISAIKNDHNVVTNYVGIFTDITEIKEHEKQLEHIAHYDTLTGIPNRVLLLDRLQQSIAQAERENKILAVCYLDLDGFKAINDKLGHSAGDEVLVEIANRIKKSIRTTDTVARIGGDEFVILLSNANSIENCCLVLENTLKQVSNRITLQDSTFLITASIGVSFYPTDNSDPDTLLRHADQAMYIAKNTGKNCFYIFDTNLDKGVRIKQSKLKDIKRGFRKKEFELVYQPKINIKSKKIIGCEALVRWNHNKLGILNPKDFLPDIANTNLEIELGQLVISKALQQIEIWNNLDVVLEVSINVTAAHVQATNFIEHLIQEISKYAIRYEQVQIEILETAAIEDTSSTVRIMEKCNKYGVSFAIDDFGTGYSSLTYLRTLPAKTLKIDQSFVLDMLRSEKDYAIVKSIINLAETFGKEIVAEGVETMDHFDALKELNCTIAQGYGIAMPMSAAHFLEWYNRWNINEN